MRKKSIIILSLILLPLVLGFGKLIDPDSVLTENQVEEYINNSNFNWNGFNVTADWFKGKFNWLSGDDYNIFNGSVLTFNQTKLAITYYNATSIDIIKGTDNTNDLTALQTYDGITYNISEAVGAPGMDVRINFTNIADFNQLTIRMRTTSGGKHRYKIQIYDYAETIWEDYTNFVEVDIFKVMDLGVYDAIDHISNGLVQVRIYLEDTGVPAHEVFLDWVVLNKGFGTFSTSEVDPLSFHRAKNLDNTGYNITGDWGNFVNINVTGTSYLGNLIIEAENISVDNINSLSGIGINITDNLNLGNYDLKAGKINATKFYPSSVSADWIAQLRDDSYEFSFLDASGDEIAKISSAGVITVEDPPTGTSTNWNAAYAHVSATGASHDYIDQAVTIISSPEFSGITLTSANIGNILINSGGDYRIGVTGKTDLMTLYPSGIVLDGALNITGVVNLIDTTLEGFVSSYDWNNLDIKPNTGNNRMNIRVYPSGTQDHTMITLMNSAAGGGYVRLEIDGLIATLKTVGADTRMILDSPGTISFFDPATASISAAGKITAADGFQDGSNTGIDTTFLDADGNTIAVSGGIIYAKIAP